MRLVFFQNIVSPHQLPFIRECCNILGIENVSLIVPEISIKSRNDMGWNRNSPIVGNVSLMVDPSIEDVDKLLKKSSDGQTIACFSGISAFPKVFEWFKRSLGYQRLRRYIITEPPFLWAHPLWMHKLRYYIRDYRYRHYIEGYFCFGPLGVDYYKNIYKHWKVFPFQYVTECRQRTTLEPKGKMKVLYVGSLTPRKNVGLIFKAIRSMNNVDVGIIGDGECKDSLLKQDQKNNIGAKFYGIQTMEKVSEIMQLYDILVLPSLHDGWGAVVNEAITLGLYVLCSDACGSKTLIRDERDGMIFKSNNVKGLRYCLTRCQENISAIRENTSNRLSCSKRIGGQAAANYFVKCLRGENPRPNWLDNR